MCSARPARSPPTSSCNCSGLAAIVFLLPIALWGWRLVRQRRLERIGWRLLFWVIGCLATAGFAGLLPVTSHWPLPTGLGGVLGDALLALPRKLLGGHGPLMLIVALGFAVLALLSLSACVGLRGDAAAEQDEADDFDLPEPVRESRAATTKTVPANPASC